MDRLYPQKWHTVISFMAEQNHVIKIVLWYSRHLIHHTMHVACKDANLSILHANLSTLYEMKINEIFLSNAQSKLF